MKIIYGTRDIKRYVRPVVALGVFDGVHRGHRQILESAVKKARAIKGTAIVVTFWPDPHREKSLYSLKHRLRLMEDIGIDAAIVIRFSRAFSRISAEDFIRVILGAKIGARYVYVGKNFKFGRYAKGDYRLLDKYSCLYGFSLKAFDIVRVNNRPVSSTYIRRLITEGRLGAAQRLLSRSVSVLGTVVRGNALGRRLGFPTANINPHHEVLPPSGVYLVDIRLEKKDLKGLCNIGFKPTFSKRHDSHTEVHIFDFDKDIYGKDLEIKFLKKIRDERKFASSCLLARQIKKDIILARSMFSLHR